MVRIKRIRALSLSFALCLPAGCRILCQQPLFGRAYCVLCGGPFAGRIR